MASELPAGAGRVIAGKYRLEAPLGRGGMGAVYAARHVVTGRRFAIKLLSSALTGDPRAEQRFTREAMLASSIQHPAIVEVYDVGRDRGVPYMVMKLLAGETLGQRLERGPLPPEQALALLLPVVDAIAAAHAHGIVHRDLKPDNVMIEREGEREQARVLDFGIGKLFVPDARRPALTRPGMVLGTPAYMSPEQVRGEAELDPRCDVYALGVMLYETVTGELPYAGADLGALLSAITAGTPPRARVRMPDLPAALDDVIAKAMASERDDRYRDAAELARALDALGLVRPSQLATGPRASRGSGAARATPPAADANAPTVPAGSLPHAVPAAPEHDTIPDAPRDSLSTTAVFERAVRHSLPPQTPLYAGAALAALALVAVIAGAALRPAPLEPARAHSAQVKAAASHAAPEAAPSPDALPSPTASDALLAPVRLPAVTVPPAVEPDPAAAPSKPPSAREPSTKRTRGPRSSPRAAPPRTRIDMPSITSEILDPFERSGDVRAGED